MSELPFIQFYPSDWLGGTRGLSAVETGVYITLIMTMYERGEPLPEDHGRLARSCGASNSAFKSALKTLLSEGKIIRTEGGLWNDRVGRELERRSKKSGVASENAKARWSRSNEKTQQKQDPKNADASDPHMQIACLPETRSQIERVCVSARAREAPPDPDEKPPDRDVSRETETVLAAWSDFARRPAGAIPAEHLHIAASISRNGAEKLIEVCERARGSPFLRGETGRIGVMPLCWLWNDEKIAKVLRGEYDAGVNSDGKKGGRSGVVDDIRELIAEAKERDRARGESFPGERVLIGRAAGAG